MVTFSDIIKGKFLEEFSAISMGDALTAIALAFVLSLFIVFIYRVTYAGVNYSASFAGCLIMLSMVTTVVILVISSNRQLLSNETGFGIKTVNRAIKSLSDGGYITKNDRTILVNQDQYQSLKRLIGMIIASDSE